MKNLLILLVVAFAFVSMCYGACSVRKAPLHCVYERGNRKFLIRAGTTRKIRRICEKCTCEMDARLNVTSNSVTILNEMVHCCDIGFRIVDFPDHCRVIRRGCTERVVTKSYPPRKCIGPVGIVGK